ncbi:hypothetical protein DY000_02026336 [Brassica cretica]|uniref:MADS-box domain-containing protein n=1 Tax=Brassica cretica TaxID=69181 RepID=A0ABQ7EJP6_BRACR|nr:hypothetical protein DY000_02026336 [Brassica cretica]
MAKISTLNEENYSSGYDGGSRVSEEVSWIKRASTRKSLRLRICTLGGRRRHRIQACELLRYVSVTMENRRQVFCLVVEAGKIYRLE